MVAIQSLLLNILSTDVLSIILGGKTTSELIQRTASPSVSPDHRLIQ